MYYERPQNLANVSTIKKQELHLKMANQRLSPIKAKMEQLEQLKMLQKKSSTVDNFYKKDNSNPYYNDENIFNLTGKIIKQKKNNYLPKIKEDKPIYQTDKKADENLKKVIMNYIKTKENYRVELNEDEPDNYFHMSEKEQEFFENNQKTKHDFLYPKQKKKEEKFREDGRFRGISTSSSGKDHKHKHSNTTINPPIRFGIDTKNSFKIAMQKKQMDSKNSNIKNKAELYQERMDIRKNKIRDYKFLDSLPKDRLGFQPKIFRPPMKVKIMSQAEIENPDKYNKKDINNYDGFSKIYFNKRKPINSINSRFFYNGGIQRKFKESEANIVSFYVSKPSVKDLEKKATFGSTGMTAWKDIQGEISPNMTTHKVNSVEFRDVSN